MDTEEAIYRKATLQSKRDDQGSTAKTLDLENRTVDIIITTSASVREWDTQTQSYLPTSIRASGVTHPDQVPLLDTHSRWGVSSVLGSVRNIRVEGDLLVGTAYYATTAEGEKAWTLAREGHLTDYSIGCIPKAHIYEGEGASINKIITSTHMFEVSNCPVGADASAKMRSAASVLEPQPPTSKTKEDTMPEDTNAQAVNEAVARALAEQKEIAVLCRAHSLDAADMIGKSVSEVKEIALRAYAEKNAPKTPETAPAQTITRGADAADKAVQAAELAVTLRTFGEGSIDKAEHKAIAREFAGFSVPEMAREILRARGLAYGGGKEDVVRRAISTSDFSNIFLNVANKSIKEGWGLAETSWRKWCQVGSVSDFKQITMTRALATTQGFREVKEGGEYKLDSRSDEKEVFAIKKYGDRIAYTYEAMVNDDLDQLKDSAVLFGEMSAHLVEALAIAELTANANMGDGNALFSGAHGNIKSGAGSSITEANLDGARQSFKKQKEGLRFLNIAPQFLLAPVELQLTADKLLNSASFSDSGADSNRVNTVANMIAASNRIYTPYLSGTKWYLAAARNTVKVFFLDGKQMPTLEQKVGYEVDGIDFKARFEVGAKATDWRGLYMADGLA